MKIKFLCLTVLSFLLLNSHAEIILRKAESAPKLDGVIRAGEWPEPLSCPFKKVVTLEPAEAKTEVRMQYDGESLYVALSNPVEKTSTSSGIFYQPRYELRFGKLPDIKIFAVTLDGRHIYPVNGWSAAGEKGLSNCGFRSVCFPVTGFIPATSCATTAKASVPCSRFPY